MMMKSGIFMEAAMHKSISESRIHNTIRSKFCGLATCNAQFSSNTQAADSWKSNSTVLVIAPFLLSNS
jgi:hypothetical protein